jgi:hypothetical protein
MSRGNYDTVGNERPRRKPSILTENNGLVPRSGTAGYCKKLKPPALQSAGNRLVEAVPKALFESLLFYTFIFIQFLARLRMNYPAASLQF